MLPNRSLGDRFGIAQAPELIARLAPDVVFIFNCFTVLPRYCSVLAHLGTARPGIVAYSPLLGEPVDANGVKGSAFNDPRNRSWTDKRVHFFGVPARREEAACSLPAMTKQRSWGVKKVCNFVRSDIHPQGELRNT